MSWAHKFDPGLKLPYQDNLLALIHEPSFKQTVGEAVFSKAPVINTLGNRAVHSHRAVPEADALAAVRELFHVSYWFARTYRRVGRPAPQGRDGGFIGGKTLSANQAPFTDLTPRGPDGLFKSAEVEALVRAIDAVRARAIAA